MSGTDVNKVGNTKDTVTSARRYFHGAEALPAVQVCIFALAARRSHGRQIPQLPCCAHAAYGLDRCRLRDIFRRIFEDGNGEVLGITGAICDLCLMRICSIATTPQEIVHLLYNSFAAISSLSLSLSCGACTTASQQSVAFHAVRVQAVQHKVKTNASVKEVGDISMRTALGTLELLHYCAAVLLQVSSAWVSYKSDRIECAQGSSCSSRLITGPCAVQDLPIIGASFPEHYLLELPMWFLPLGAKWHQVVSTFMPVCVA